MIHTKATKIFIGCLPKDTETEDLKQYLLSHCPEIQNLKVKYRSNKLCAGYANFITTCSKRTIDRFLNQNHLFNGRKLECRPFLTGEKMDSFFEELIKKRIYVNKIPAGVGDAELNDCFSAFGKVNKAYIANLPEGQKDLFGFVVMEKIEDAERILQLQVILRGMTLILKKSTNRNSKKNCSKKEEFSEKKVAQRSKRRLDILKSGKRHTSKIQKTRGLAQIQIEDSLNSSMKKLRIKSHHERKNLHRPFKKNLKLKKLRLPVFEHLESRNLRTNPTRRAMTWL